MKPIVWLGIVLLVLGVVGFARGGFSYTKKKDEVKLGPIEVQVKDKERVRLSPALSGLAVAGGLVLVVAGARKR